MQAGYHQLVAEVDHFRVLAAITIQHLKTDYIEDFVALDGNKTGEGVLAGAAIMLPFLEQANNIKNDAVYNRRNDTVYQYRTSNNKHFCT